MARNGVLVVTGGGRGIGAATALLAAERGYAVVVNYSGNVEAAEAVTAAIHAKGGEAIAVRGDVSQPEDVEHIFAAADRLGTLTGLVNNAGIVGRSSKFVDMATADLHRVFAVNVFGAFLCAREAVKRMSTASGGKGGAIVNISSGAATLGSPGEFIHYAASKGAINTMTLGLSKELAREGIRVNAIEPGMIDTEMQTASGDLGRMARIVPTVPMARAGLADEVAGPILFLLSDAASYMTGAILRVAGGR